MLLVIGRKITTSPKVALDGATLELTSANYDYVNYPNLRFIYGLRHYFFPKAFTGATTSSN